MTDIVLALAYLAIPFFILFSVRSVTWTVAALGGALAVLGAFVAFTIDLGHRWTFGQLQVLVLVTLGFVLIAGLWIRRRHGTWGRAGLRYQMLAIGLPVAAGLLIVLISRLIAAPTSGMFTAVGFLIKRIHAEDNAKWLDFTSQLVTGEAVDQVVALGGPLQLFLVMIATLLGAVSHVLLGGFNEVFVSANTVVYAEFGLAALAGLALAPIAERRFRIAGERRLLALPTIWSGVAVIGVGSLAASGLGHLTLQYVMLVMGLWVAAFMVNSRVPYVRAMTSIGVVGAFLVWFPILPIALLVLAIGVVVSIKSVARSAASLGNWAVLLGWTALAVFTFGQVVSSLRYMTETAVSAAPEMGGTAGGIRAAVPGFALPKFDLLFSQGGTEQVAPSLAILAVLSAILAFRLVADGTKGLQASLTRGGPALLLVVYGLALAVLGTWLVGIGPNYGALKTTYLATIVVLAVTLPLALTQLDRSAVKTSLIQVGGITAVFYLLTVDGLLPRAATYISPQQWPAVAGEDRGYWWPAEVQTAPEQTIASLPISCAFRLDPRAAPSALPDGQAMYSCTRLLTGLSGADTTGFPLVSWQKREWFTNMPAWDEEYPGLIEMPDELRLKDFILLDFNKQVIGLESVQNFLDKFRPPWAQ